MGEIQIKEKYVIYLQNSLYIIFDEYCQNPKEVGEAVGLAISRTIEDMYPSRNAEDIPAIKGIRGDWLFLFHCGISKALRAALNRWVT